MDELEKRLRPIIEEHAGNLIIKGIRIGFLLGSVVTGIIAYIITHR